MNDTNELKLIYEFLGIEMAITTKGNEVKGWICTPEGTQKFYLNQKDCLEVAEAFTRLSAMLKNV